MRWLREHDPLIIDIEDEPKYDGDPPADVSDELAARYEAAVAEWVAVQWALRPLWKAAYYPNGYPIEQKTGGV